MPFVKFAIDPPNSISQEEAEWLRAQLLVGGPSEAATQAGLKIQRALDTDVAPEATADVTLTDAEKREAISVLDDAFVGSGQDEVLIRPGAAERLRWLQENLKSSLGEDAH